MKQREPSKQLTVRGKRITLKKISRKPKSERKRRTTRSKSKSGSRTRSKSKSGSRSRSKSRKSKKEDLGIFAKFILSEKNFTKDKLFNIEGDEESTRKINKMFTDYYNKHKKGGNLYNTIIELRKTKLLDVIIEKILFASSSEYFRLNLSRNEITDITPLSNLTNLMKLNLSENFIEDLSPIKNLKSLKILNLKENEISDISPLENLTNLHTLILDENFIEDLSPVRALRKENGKGKLQNLTYDGNPVNN